jgi:hypothetical protein
MKLNFVFCYCGMDQCKYKIMIHYTANDVVFDFFAFFSTLNSQEKSEKIHKVGSLGYIFVY